MMHDSEAFSPVGYGITDTWPGLGIQHGQGHDTDTGMGTGINSWVKGWLEMCGVSRARRRGIHTQQSILGCAGFTAQGRHMTEER